METIEITKNDIFLNDYRGRLTEGISYNEENNSILWVDIRLGELHRVLLEENKHEVITTEEGESIGTMGFTKDVDIYMVGLKEGIGKANFKTLTIEYLKKYEPVNGKLRSNDGKVDPWGNLIIGTMYDFPFEDDLKNEGTLYRIDNDLSKKFEILVTDCYVPNGLGFNSQQDKFYWVDLVTGIVFLFDYDTKTHKFSNRREFLNIKTVLTNYLQVDGVPDGMFIDNNENMWVATFGGSSVLKFNLKGELLSIYKLPAKNITCMTLGGGYLWINTCLEGSTDLSIKSELITTGDLGGYLFRIKCEGEEPQYKFNLK